MRVCVPELTNTTAPRRMLSMRGSSSDVSVMADVQLSCTSCASRPASCSANPPVYLRTCSVSISPRSLDHLAPTQVCAKVLTISPCCIHLNIGPRVCVYVQETSLTSRIWCLAYPTPALLIKMPTSMSLTASATTLAPCTCIYQ